MTDLSHATISVVIPAFNEEANVPPLYDRLSKVLHALGHPYEVIFMDNHSTDATSRLAKEIAARDRRWKYIRLSRNFGYQLNISAGISYASGDAIVIMDADLQDPPELVGEFVRWWKEGYDVVYGVRVHRTGEPFWRTIMIKLYYKLLHKFCSLDLPLDAGDFRLISRRVQREFLKFQESYRYARGLFSYIGYHQKGIPYERQARFAGESKFPLLGMISLGLDGIFSFTMLPIRLMTTIGLSVVASGTLYSILAIWLYFTGSPPPGWTTLIILLLILSGMIIVFLGVVGEYVGRTYIEAKKRPLWIVDEEINVDSPAG